VCRCRTASLHEDYHVKITVQDLGGCGDPQAVTVTSGSALKELLIRWSQPPPRVVQVLLESGEHVDLGIGGRLSFLQLAGVEGLPPCLRSVSECAGEEGAEECFELLCGDTPTPIPLKDCVPLDVALGVAEFFVERGRLPGSVSWVEV
jgi:hypothetical protein